MAHSLAARIDDVASMIAWPPIHAFDLARRKAARRRRPVKV
jgi:hypothetical protein